MKFWNPKGFFHNKENRNVHLISWNAGGLKSKLYLPEFIQMVNTADILCTVETWSIQLQKNIRSTLQTLIVLEMLEVNCLGVGY